MAGVLSGTGLGVVLAAAAAAQPNAAVPAGSIAFDIPSQPLDHALDDFAAASGLQIFYENAVTGGQRSAAVQGMFEPRAALRVLLSGSGLTARVIAPGTISVVRPPASDTAAARRQSGRGYLPYYGFVQAGVMTVLCAHADTRPGNYHIALQYWIDPAGRLDGVKLIGSSGSAARDAAVMNAMQGLALPPPGNMPQPVTMAIEPMPPSEPDGCPSGGVHTPGTP